MIPSKGVTDITRRRVIALVIFVIWLAVVVCAAWKHAVWRDEVRALTKALDGQNVVAMFKGLPSEGHPAIWYLLLRGAHALWPRPQVLQIVALLVAAPAALLLLLYSPFRWELKVVLLAGNMFLFEYSVVARNYGISVLLLFLLATFYERHKDRGPLLGVLLFMLANCNAPSVLLVGGFLLFWGADVVGRKSVKRPRALRTLGWNTAVALGGVAVCVLTVLPPSYSSTPQGASPAQRGWTAADWSVKPAARSNAKLRRTLEGIFFPGPNLRHLIVLPRQTDQPSPDSDTPLSKLLLSVVLLGATFGLIRYPGIFIAAVATLTGFSLFTTFFYAFDYRQEALWLCFLIACYWIAENQGKPPELRIPARWQTALRRTSTVGWSLFVLLAAIQVPIGIGNVLAATGDGPPFSCSRDLGDLIRRTPNLQQAIVTAEPEYLLEPLPYYVSNPTYLLREQRFGNAVSAQLSRTKLSLGDVLSSARNLQTTTNKPVLILLGTPLDAFASAQTYRGFHGWEFVVTPDEQREFAGATQLIESFPAAITDEHFDVYLLK
jgi:hypothetical protein